jgi:DNA primase
MKSMEAKEEIRSRLAIEDVVGEYVQLKRAGRNWKGLSPFSQEKTPSFFVSPDKGIWHDFSSNKGGDIFSFVMEMEGLDFRGAIELLARKAGVDMSLYETERGQGLAKKKQRLLGLLDAASTFYQRRLLSTPHAVDYVAKRRGLSRDVVHDFRIGYAPGDGGSLMKFLRSKGFSDPEIKDAGLSSMRRGGVGDMFRDRMMVSLADGQGQVVGFTARLISDDVQAPKYINTPQTLLYDKSRNVFGLHLAKEAIRTNDYAVIVEGNLDVVSSHQAGVKQVVATAGTALTENHLKILSRLTHHVRLAFDGDKAGIAATERAIPIAQSVGVELTIVTLPGDVKDPDELIKQDPKLWVAAIESPQPAVEWIIDQYARRVDLSTAAGKRQLTTEALKLVMMLRDPIERDHYLQILAARTGASLEALNERLKQLSEPLPDRRLKPHKAETSEDAAADDLNQDYILALMCIEPAVHDVAKKLTEADFGTEERRALFKHLFEHPGQIDAEKLPSSLLRYETYVKIVLFKAETRYTDEDGQSRLIEAVSLVRRIKHQQQRQKKQHLTEALRQAEADHDDVTALRLQHELMTLIKEEKRA